ncbi:cyclase family protein [Thermorudis peleae]|uniref:cyclase family protein n=1 Tax=Thermorudis peleae TaxID=1382356 RepID=UPI00056DA27F|nr:cyclase family protein [Thermorudis peleae]
MMVTFELSHEIWEGMTIFPGDPEPRFSPHPLPPPWRVTALHLGTHTGTHVDAPAHVFPNGKTIDEYPVDRFLGTGYVLDVTGLAEATPITAAHILPQLEGFHPGWFALVRTGWDVYWGTERYLHHPYLAEDAVAALVDAGASLVGIDALNVDATQSGTSATHERLLGADVLIVENLRGLAALEAQQPYRCAFLPLRLRGLDGAPIRAVAWRDTAP